MSLTPEIPEHLLGFKNQPQWLDMSDYVIHFTGTEATFRSILRHGEVEASGPFGWARRYPHIEATQKSACFSEVPLSQAHRVMGRHGKFGIAFPKDFILENGGGRVWYLDDGSIASRSFFELVGGTARAGDWSNSVWSLTPFVDRVMPNKYAWEWEREWRVPGGLMFTLRDIAFTITPDGIEEMPSVQAPVLHPKHEVLLISAWPEALERELEEMVASFLERFENPVNSLPVDGGEYVWIVECWETPDAIEHVFGPLEPSFYDALETYLTDISYEWVRLADWETFYE